MKCDFTRREFLHFGARTLASSAMLSTLGGLQRVLAGSANTTGYKALVCLYMYGGNDGFNWFVPLTPAGYSTYANTRTSLALAQNTLLPLNGTASDGYTYGIHPSCPEIQKLFNSKNIAVLCNVGTLVQPTTPALAQSGTNLPSQLFSHLDQQTLWQTSIANSPARYGWAGRVADVYSGQGYSSQLNMNINVGVANYWQQGQQTNPYVLGTGGAPILDDTSNSSYRNGLRAQTAAALLGQAVNDPNLMVAQYAAIQNSAAAKVTIVNNALGAAGDLTTAFPSYPNDSDLGAQLHEVARVIKAQPQIGDARQIFFVSMNGFDTHNSELSNQAPLLQIVSANLNAFWTAMGEINMRSNVTLFTASDFGRTLGSNGNGADHAWGNHHVIMGGAVQGGQYYGTMPTLTIGGPNDFGPGLGQMIPTTSTDQYAATLANWFGVASNDLDTVFPNLGNFSTPTLGFLG
jgi:uncharacterized protein (DUF1501 family)